MDCCWWELILCSDDLCNELVSLLAHPFSADSLTTPIVQTATYTFQDTAELIAYQEGRYGSYEYGR